MDCSGCRHRRSIVSPSFRRSSDAGSQKAMDSEQSPMDPGRGYSAARGLRYATKDQRAVVFADRLACGVRSR